MAATAKPPFQRRVRRRMDDDREDVTPRQARRRRVPKPLPATDQLVLDLTTKLLDQIEEPEDSPTVAPWLNTI